MRKVSVPSQIVRSIWSWSDFFRIFYASCTAYFPKQYQMLELMCNTLKDSKMAGAKNYFLLSFCVTNPRFPAVLTNFKFSSYHIPGRYSLSWPIRRGFPRKGYFFQDSGS